MAQVSCGTIHTLLLDDEGYAYSAGCPDEGQLGVIHYQFTPKKCEQPFVYLSVFTKQNPGKKVCAGDGFSVFLDTWGAVYTCGKANFGRLGQGHTYSLNNPAKIGWFAKNKIAIKDIEAGGRHCLAISNEAVPKLYGWGFGFYHQLGQKGDNEDFLDPVPIQVVENELREGPDGTSTVVVKQKAVKRVTCGYFHSGVILKSK